MNHKTIRDRVGFKVDFNLFSIETVASAAQPFRRSASCEQSIPRNDFRIVRTRRDCYCTKRSLMASRGLAV